MKHRTPRWSFAAVCTAVILLTSIAARAAADDGYTSPFAQAVRTATTSYRLVLWARADHYIQTTGYVDGIGLLYTNHDRFNPPDLSHPSMLIYDEGGRLLACGYQFTAGATYPPAFASVPSSAWYDIPKHVHYNALQNGVMHYGQAAWETDDQPTTETLRAHGLLPADATLVVAFVHPATRAFLVWAWLPNVDGLFASENAMMP
jgi:hypothetical protein